MNILSVEKLQALVDFQEKINKLNFDQIIRFIAVQIIKILKVERCAIFRISGDSETAFLVAGEPEEEHGLGMSFPLESLPALKEVVESRKLLKISDPRNDPRTLPSKELIIVKDINAILFTPLVSNGEVIGVIAVDACCAKKNFTEEETHFCLILSNLVGLLVERDSLSRARETKRRVEILGQAAAEAAHRIRNPLVGIGGFARRLQKQITNPGQETIKEEASRIVEEVAKLERFLTGLLDFSREKLPKPEMTDIEAIAEKARELTESLAAEKKIKFKLDLDGELPKIFVDSLEIQDVLLSLIRNAIEAVEKEGEIFIKIRPEENFVRISVTNTGGCIDETIVDAIFNPFFTTKKNGVGLGLSTANAIVNSYGGEIKVENDQNLRLTTFIVRLPCKNS